MFVTKAAKLAAWRQVILRVVPALSSLCYAAVASRCCAANRLCGMLACPSVEFVACEPAQKNRGNDMLCAKEKFALAHCTSMAVSVPSALLACLAHWHRLTTQHCKEELP